MTGLELAECLIYVENGTFFHVLLELICERERNWE